MATTTTRSRSRAKQQQGAATNGDGVNNDDSASGDDAQTPAEKAARQQTEYVVLEQFKSDGSTERDGVLLTAVEEGRVWVESGPATRGQRGVEAIKAATLTPDGYHRPGDFKAVPESTWNADANNLGIAAQEKIVNQFSAGVRNGAAS